MLSNLIWLGRLWKLNFLWLTRDWYDDFFWCPENNLAPTFLLDVFKRRLCVRSDSEKVNLKIISLRDSQISVPHRCWSFAGCHRECELIPYRLVFFSIPQMLFELLQNWNDVHFLWNRRNTAKFSSWQWEADRSHLWRSSIQMFKFKFCGKTYELAK